MQAAAAAVCAFLSGIVRAEETVWQYNGESHELQTRLNRELHQHLQQSGLLQLLPMLMTAAAQQLTTQGQHMTSTQEGQQCLALAALLLQMQARLFNRWICVPAGLQVCACTALPTAHLALAVLQAVSSSVQHHQTGPPAEELHILLYKAMSSACSAISELSRNLTVARKVLQQPLAELPGFQQSPQLLSCLAVMACVVLSRSHRKHSRNSSGSGRTTAVPSAQESCSAPRRSDILRQECMQAWQASGRSSKRFTPCQQRLFEVLGVDGRSVLWAAAAPTKLPFAESYSCQQQVSDLLQHFDALVLAAQFASTTTTATAGHIMPQRQRQPADSARQKQQQQEQQELLMRQTVLLMLPAVLPWAAVVATGAADGGSLQHTLPVAVTAVHSIIACSCSINQQANGYVAVEAGSLFAPSLSWEKNLLLDTSQWAVEVLPPLLKLCLKVLQHLPPAAAKAGTNEARDAAAAAAKPANPAGTVAQTRGVDPQVKTSRIDVGSAEWLLGQLVTGVNIVLVKYCDHEPGTDSQRHTPEAPAEQPAASAVAATPATTPAAVQGRDATPRECSQGGSVSGGTGGGVTSRTRPRPVVAVQDSFLQAHAYDVLVIWEMALRQAMEFSTIPDGERCADALLLALAGGLQSDEAGPGPLLRVAHAACDDRRGQQQLYSLLGSMMKHSSSALRTSLHMNANGEAAVLVAHSLLAHCAAPSATKQSSCAGRQSANEVLESYTQHEISFPAVSASSLTRAAVISLVPSLVLLGRWQLQSKVEICLLSGCAQEQQPQQQQEQRIASAAAYRLAGCSQQVVSQHPGTSGTATDACTHTPPTAVPICLDPVLRRCAFGLATVWSWLQNPNVSAHLSAVGYQPQCLLLVAGGVLQAWEAALDRLAAADFSMLGDGKAGRDAIELLVQRLEACGQAFTSLALPVFCNNPDCDTITGASEHQLVNGKSCLCAGCKTARYCGRSFQNAHWSQHKPICKALAAAAAAAVAADTVDSSSG